MVMKFTVTGEPKGKGRPRFNPYARHSRPRTPEDTVVYENWIALQYSNQCGDMFPNDAAISMTIKAYYRIPKRTSRKDRVLMEMGTIRPTKKPDLDNVIKVYADALNEVAYHDDTQIVSLACEKLYSDNPRVEVVLESVKQ